MMSGFPPPKSAWYNDGTLAVQIDTVRSFCVHPTYESDGPRTMRSLLINTKHGTFSAVYSSAEMCRKAFDALAKEIKQ